jgi:nucleoid-associated protein YgaU
MAAKTIALHGAGGGSGAAPDLTRAALELYEARPIASGSEPGSPIDRIPFQFNPKELSISKSASWGRSNARDAKTAGSPQFNGADPCKMTFELFFDATDTLDGSVVTRVEQLFACCVPTNDSWGKKKSLPPLVVLHWGDVTSFAGFVTSVQAKYTLFTGKGMPIRATCNVSLEEMPGDPLKQNPTSGSLTLTSVRTVVAGDSLASIAYREYGDPAMWRPLAAFNGIDDPLRLRLGSSVLLPVVDDLAVGV